MLTAISQVSADWLTTTLNTAGNPVQAFEVVREGQSNVSSFYHLRLTYAQPDANAPDALFLKLVRVEYPEFFGKELTFYREIAPRIRTHHPAFTVLPCYAGAYDSASGRAYLLFDDVSGTHADRHTIDPTLTHEMQLIDGFAMLHAAWWEHPALGEDVGQAHTTDGLNRSLARVREKIAAFQVAPYPPDARWQTALDHVAETWVPRRYQQMVSGTQMTLVHRDAHPGNFLYPRPAYPDTRPLIIDWDAWRVDHGTVDLAYMMAFHHAADKRARRERTLLRHYHQCLQRYGVQSYTWEACLLDYRASIVRCLLFMLSVWRPERQPGDAWWQIVGRGVQAYHDFACHELRHSS